MLGRVDVDAMLAEIPAAAFQEWRAYFDLEPFGPWRDSVHSAIIAQQVRNVLGGRARLNDFIPRFGRDTSSDWVRVCQAWSESRQASKEVLKVKK